MTWGGRSPASPLGCESLFGHLEDGVSDCTSQLVGMLMAEGLGMLGFTRLAEGKAGTGQEVTAPSPLGRSAHHHSHVSAGGGAFMVLMMGLRDGREGRAGSKGGEVLPAPEPS